MLPTSLRCLRVLQDLKLPPSSNRRSGVTAYPSFLPVGSPFPFPSARPLTERGTRAFSFSLLLEHWRDPAIMVCFPKTSDFGVPSNAGGYDPLNSFFCPFIYSRFTYSNRRNDREGEWSFFLRSTRLFFFPFPSAFFSLLGFPFSSFPNSVFQLRLFIEMWGKSAALSHFLFWPMSALPPFEDPPASLFWMPIILHSRATCET